MTSHLLKLRGASRKDRKAMFLQVAMMPCGNKDIPQLSRNPREKAYPFGPPISLTSAISKAHLLGTPEKEKKTKKKKKRKKPPPYFAVRILLGPLCTQD